MDSSIGDLSLHNPDSKAYSPVHGSADHSLVIVLKIWDILFGSQFSWRGGHSVCTILSNLSATEGVEAGSSLLLIMQFSLSD